MSPTRLTDRRLLGALVAIATAVAVAGCKKTENPPADTAAPAVAPAPDTAKPAAAAAPAINDAQIAHIAVTANAIDSAAGALAKKKAGQGREGLRSDHGHRSRRREQAGRGARDEAQRHARGQRRQQAAQGRRRREHREPAGLSGAAFDKAYIDHEVAYHQAVLDALDKTLIPSAQNAELKALLVKVRPAFVAHLDRAKSIQASLAK